jgi:hypothetical protein
LRDKERLRERIVELESELRLVLEESGRKPSEAAEADAARQAFEDLLAMQSGEGRNPERLRSLIKHLAHIDGRAAKYFIALFQNSKDVKGEEKKVAMKLALMSGGPDAADFILQLLTNPTIDSTFREQLLSELIPNGGSFFSIRRLPVSESLASTALQLVQSTNVADRHAGANLLGGVRSPAARGELIRLLQDSDSDIREMAAQSLGRVGDQSTKKILESYAAQTTDVKLQKAAAEAIRQLDQGDGGR